MTHCLINNCVNTLKYLQLVKQHAKSSIITSLSNKIYWRFKAWEIYTVFMINFTFDEFDRRLSFILLSIVEWYTQQHVCAGMSKDAARYFSWNPIGQKMLRAEWQTTPQLQLIKRQMSDSPRRSLFFLLSVQIRDDHAPQHVRANLQTALDRRHDRLLLDL